MASKVKIDIKALERLQANSAPVLADLGAICLDTAKEVLSTSKPLVPIGEDHKEGEPRLIDTAVIGAPEKNPRHLSITATAGYSHHEAAAIHEGIHYGFHTVNPPPHFLKLAVKPSRTPFKKRIAAQLMATLEKLLPKT